MRWICVVDVAHDPGGENNDYNNMYCGKSCDYCDEGRLKSGRLKSEGDEDYYCRLFEKELENDQNAYGDGGVRRCTQCVDYCYQPADFEMADCQK